MEANEEWSGEDDDPNNEPASEGDLNDDDELEGKGLKLQSIDQIDFTDQLCNIIAKLPCRKKDLIPSSIKDTLTYREFTFLMGAIGLRTPRTRTKIDMIELIVSYAGDLWNEIHTAAIAFKGQRQNAQKKRESKHHRESSDSSAAKGLSSGQSRKKTTKSLLISPAQRSPYDPTLASLLSSLYMDSENTLNDNLLIPHGGSTKFSHAFKALKASAIENNQCSQQKSQTSSSTPMADILCLQMIQGQTNTTLGTVEEYERGADSVADTIKSLSKFIEQKK